MDLNNLNESLFKLDFNFETICSNLNAINEDPIESTEDLIWLLDEVLNRVIVTIEGVEYYEEDTCFLNYDDVDDLIDMIREKFEGLKEIIEIKSSSELLEEMGTDCTFLPCFPGDEYHLTVIFRNVDFGRLGCSAVFEKCTSDVNCEGIPLSMNVEVWSSKEGKGYDFSEGKLDDEFDGSQSLHYWKLAGNTLPNELVF
jgi:hypothetical protein